MQATDLVWYCPNCGFTREYRSLARACCAGGKQLATPRAVAEQARQVFAMRAGKFVIGRVQINGAGFEEYRFAENPFVHSGEAPAVCQAKALARKHEANFAVFRKLALVGLEAQS